MAQNATKALSEKTAQAADEQELEKGRERMGAMAVTEKAKEILEFKAANPKEQLEEAHEKAMMSNAKAASLKVQLLILSLFGNIQVVM